MRLVKKSFTVVDVKVQNGNNRQLDLLSYNIESSTSYHIESTVTHRLNWKPNMETLIELFIKKFLGFTKPTAKRKEPFLDEILHTYKGFGIMPITKRVICVRLNRL